MGSLRLEITGVKHIDMNTLIEDINKSLQDLSLGKEKLSEELIEQFGEDVKEALRHWSTPREQKGFTLRVSNIGKPLRKLWFEKRYPSDEPISSSLSLKFLYGHLLEHLVLMLVKLSGHTVTDEQKEIELNGIKGHIDCKIDGKVVDVKSASKFAFNKFENDSLSEDDPFGYIAQLSTYEQAEGTDGGYFLVINKETGELCTYAPDDFDKPHAPSLINNVTTSLDSDSIPKRCFPTVAEGKKGNQRINKNCNYCEFKKECYKDSNDGKGLRVFKYAKGPMYLETVVSEPKVEEIYEW